MNRRSPETYEEVATRITHVLHCAASVSFEDPYDKSYINNVVGARSQGAFRFPAFSSMCLPRAWVRGLHWSWILKMWDLNREGQGPTDRELWDSAQKLPTATTVFWVNPVG